MRTPDPALGELVDQVEGVADRAAEAIERVHDDHVALARIVDRCAQAWAVDGRP